MAAFLACTGSRMSAAIFSASSFAGRFSSMCFKFPSLCDLYVLLYTIRGKKSICMRNRYRVIADDERI